MPATPPESETSGSETSVSAQPTPHRRYDVVLFGVTGFTGTLVARYLSAHLPETARWAIAGRNRSKLTAVRHGLPQSGVAAAPSVLEADVTDPESMRRMAESARVVITTVGPYLEHGEPVVRACAEAGTDYVDLTGEPEFMDRMYVAHHTTAEKTGARLVHACGFDSVPHDLGAYFTVQQLSAQQITASRRTPGPISMRGVVLSNAMFSGGTIHSALGQLSRPRQLRHAARERRQAEPAVPHHPETGVPRRARYVPGSPRKDARLGLWLMPLPTCDPIVITRSARASEAYGPDFSYSHYAGMTRARSLVKAATTGTGLMVAAQVGPLRRLIGRRIPRGEGPSPRRRQRSWFTVDFIGEAAETTVHTRVSGGDPGYDETAKMLSEAAMSLAFDENPDVSGQVTTVTAMGDNLLQRLINAGMSFSVVD